MRKLYGSSLRKEAGLTKTIRSVALKNARFLERSRVPEFKEIGKKVRGRFGRTAEAVEGFLANATPNFSEVVRGTGSLLQQSREHFVITY